MRPHRLDAGLRWRAVAAALFAVGGLMLTPSSPGALAGTTEATAPGPAVSVGVVRVLVEAQDGMLEEADRAAASVGRVVSVQRALGTLVADVSSDAVSALRRRSAVRAVTVDSRVHLQSVLGPTGTPGDMTNVARLTGATTFWKNGYTGQGVDVALLDSGVLPVEGLTTPNKLVIGPDLSFESQLPNLRGAGHVRPRHPHGGHHRRPGLGHRRRRRTRATPPTSSGWHPGRASSASSWPTRRADRRLAGDRRRSTGS